MIRVTSLSNKEFILNAEHIEKIDSVPESMITLTNGNKYIVTEDFDEIIRRVLEYKRKIHVMDLQEDKDE